MAGESSCSEQLVPSSKSNRTRVGVILRQTLGAKSANGSVELTELKQRYQTMCQNLKTLQKALRERHAALLTTAQTRISVAKAMSCMSQETPLKTCAGREDGDKEITSYYNTMVDKLETRAKKRADDFQKFAIDYVAEWESTVTTRINADIKATETLRQEADHYQPKVDSLQASVKKLQDNNKPVPDSTIEKLERNQKKLQEASTAYSDAAQDLYLLMDEVVDRSWRDLHPLLLQMVQWDMDTCQEECDALTAPLTELSSNLTLLGKKEMVKPRLRDVVDGTPGMLSTRPGGIKEVTLSFGIPQPSTTTASTTTATTDDENIPEPPQSPMTPSPKKKKGLFAKRPSN